MIQVQSNSAALYGWQNWFFTQTNGNTLCCISLITVSVGDNREPQVQRTPAGCRISHPSATTVYYWIIHRAGMKNSSWENWVKTFNQA